jgi:hypothetical protein
MAAALAQVQGNLLFAACGRAAGFQSADKPEKKMAYLPSQ